ncbi:MAG: hypothetical protein ABJD07_10460, partial [Gemmatimonadaceae bacterium]
AIYAAMLRDSGVPLPPADVALDRRTLSDSGKLSTSDFVPESAAAFLMRRGLISEICPIAGDSCPERAHWVMRLSLPVPESPGVVRVYKGGHNAKPRSDTSPDPLTPLGGSYVCHVRWRWGRWRLAECEGLTVG